MNIVLSVPQLADVQQIMEERGVLYLSDYVRQLVARDIREWRTEHYEQFAAAKQQNSAEFQDFLKWKKAGKTDAGS